MDWVRVVRIAYGLERYRKGREELEKREEEVRTDLGGLFKKKSKSHGVNKLEIPDEARMYRKKILVSPDPKKGRGNG